METTNKRKKLLMMIGLSILLIMGAGATYALLTHQSEPASNVFKGSNVNVAVIEKDKQHEDYTNKNEAFDTIVKGQETAKVVSIKNVNSKEFPTTETYVKVRLVPVFRSNILDDTQRGTGDTLGGVVEIKYNFAKNIDKASWKMDDQGNFYYTAVLAPGDTSATLLASVELLSDVPVGYHLEVQVLADAIQARPASALQEAWGMTDFSQLKPVPATMYISSDGTLK